MRHLKFVIIVTIFLFIVACETSRPVLATPQRMDAVGDLWLDVSMGRPLVDWFNQVAQPDDIARADHISQLGLLDGITVGRKLVVFKSASDAEQIVPDIANQIDIIGYNLEHGPANPPVEQADPVGSIQRMRRLADEYGLALALGPDHRFALSDGVAMAPYVDIFVLQVQVAQTRPAEVRDFVIPLAKSLREANPDVKISVQVRTEGDVVEIVDLIASMLDSIDGVSILTSPETVDIAEDLVQELRPPGRATDRPNESGDRPAPLGRLREVAALEPTPAARPERETSFWSSVLGGAAVAGLLAGGVLALTAAWAFKQRTGK